MRRIWILVFLLCPLLFGGCGGTSTSPTTTSSPTSQTLREVRQQAIEEIESYLDLRYYYDDEIEEINDWLTIYRGKIQEERDKDQIWVFVRECKGKLDLVKDKDAIDYEKEINDPTLGPYLVRDFMQKGKHYEILMIGSSYVYYWDQYKMLENILNSEGFDVSIEQVVKGSTALEKFNIVNSDLYRALQNKLESVQYDYIFLEEISTRPINYPNLFDEAVGTLLERFAATQDHAETILFETWARHDDNDWYDDHRNYDYEKMKKEVADVYTRVANKYNLRVSYCGLSFAKAYKEQNIDVYHTDYTHPSPLGSYLCALNHYNTLTGLDPKNVSYYPDLFTANAPERGKIITISEEEAIALQNCVVNEYDDYGFKELSICVYASSTTSTFFTANQLKIIKKRLSNEIESNIVYRIIFAEQMSHEEFRRCALRNRYDVLLSNEEDELIDELEGTIRVGERWSNSDSNYIYQVNANMISTKLVEMLRNDKPRKD